MEYYPINLKLRGEICLVVGGGNIALRKIEGLLKAGAKIKVVAPDCDRALIDYAERGLIDLHLREFRDSDIAGCSLVIGATNYSEVNNRIFEVSHEKNIPVHF